MAYKQAKVFVRTFDGVPADGTYPDDENVDPSGDTRGAIFVTPLNTVVPPPPTNGVLGNAFGSSFDLPAGWYSAFNGFSAGAGTAYVQFFTANPAPAAVPDIQCIPVAPGQAFSWAPSFSVQGPVFVRVSSTPDTYTALAQDIWLHYEGGN